MKNISFILFVLLISQLVIAQEQPFYKTYNWQENPSYKVEENLTQDLIAVKDKILTEFYFEGDGLVEYFLEHRVLWLNSDDRIEEYNKVYLPYSSTSQLEINKARVITKEGKVIELDDSKILIAQNEETGKNYKYFAFEGIEKGSFIEYYYVLKRSPRYKGNRIFLQSSFNKENVEFDVYAPTNLIFKFKSYNNLPQVTQDTLSKDKLHWQLKVNHLKGLEKETLSAYNALRSSIIYKLDRNKASNAKDISSYGKVAQNIHSYYYPEFSKKEINNLNDIIKEVKSENNKTEEELIRNIEFYIKNNFAVTEEGNDDFDNLEYVLKNRIASETGIIKLFTSIFKTLNIKHEIVITSDRSDLKFDNNFEAINFLTDFLIYFPKTKKYLSPNQLESRYGFPPPYFTDNYGLFIKEVKVGNFISGVGKIKYIKPVKADKTIDNMTLDVSFDTNNLTNCKVKLDRAMTGYYAIYTQPFMHLIKQEDKDEIIEGLAKQLDDNVIINSKTIKNADPKLFGVKPIHFIIDFNSEAFVEKAGKRYLFKVGELIGPQMQLYQKRERVLPIEEEHNRSYYRTLKITIPEGYKVSNLDDININNSYAQKGKDILLFKSSYQLEGNVLTITANEFYDSNILDVSLYDEYRKVVNSAADFNKITLILEPLE